jgi:hypothetical protein
MENLKEWELFDTIQNSSHLFLGLLIGYSFWAFCENRAKGGISYINPIWFLVMLIWGASGFFFLPYNQFPIVQLFYYAVPDWDIPLAVWTSFDILNLGYWSFISLLVPLIFLVILLHKRRSNINHRRSIFQDVAIGLSVGISAHLIGDALWQSISISTISLCILIFFGLVIPFFVIHQLNENSPKK